MHRIAGRHRNGRCGHHHQPVLGKATSDQAAVRAWVDADGDIELLFHQIDRTVLGHHLQCDLRIGRTEVGADVPHRQLGEQHRRRHAQAAPRCGQPLARGRHRLGHFAQRHLGALHQLLPCLGELESTRTAFDQAHPQLFLQFGDAPRQGRLRSAARAAGLAQPLVGGHQREIDQGIEVHAVPDMRRDVYILASSYWQCNGISLPHPPRPHRHQHTAQAASHRSNLPSNAGDSP